MFAYVYIRIYTYIYIYVHAAALALALCVVASPGGLDTTPRSITSAYICIREKR